MYSTSNGCRSRKDLFYDTTNMFESTKKLVIAYTKNKVWEIANALNPNQSKVTPNQMND